MRYEKCLQAYGDIREFGPSGGETPIRVALNDANFVCYCSLPRCFLRRPIVFSRSHRMEMHEGLLRGV